MKPSILLHESVSIVSIEGTSQRGRMVSGKVTQNLQSLLNIRSMNAFIDIGLVNVRGAQDSESKKIRNVHIQYTYMNILKI